jgi:hypothetical protein
MVCHSNGWLNDNALQNIKHILHTSTLLLHISLYYVLYVMIIITHHTNTSQEPLLGEGHTTIIQE